MERKVKKREKEKRKKGKKNLLLLESSAKGLCIYLLAFVKWWQGRVKVSNADLSWRLLAISLISNILRAGLCFTHFSFCFPCLIGIWCVFVHVCVKCVCVPDTAVSQSVEPCACSLYLWLQCLHFCSILPTQREVQHFTILCVTKCSQVAE